MKIIIAIVLALGLASCASNPILIREKIAKIEISDELFECPVLKKYPNPEKLTDIQVAKLIVELHRNNKKCKTSIDAIKQFIDDYNKTVDQ
jgi:hypothetical protein